MANEHGWRMERSSCSIGMHPSTLKKTNHQLRAAMKLAFASHCIEYLVGGLEHQFYFPINIGFLIIPSDEVIFFRGVALAHQPDMYETCYFTVFFPWARVNHGMSG